MPRRPAPSPLNAIWLFLITFATVVAAYNGNMQAVTEASFEAAEGAVELAIGLIGAMAFWLGIMRVVETGGLMLAIARWIRPVMVRLFPSVPPEHPAMSAMILNMAANALGLGNAATPMGLRAMKELNRLNPRPGTATNAMCLFLAINTSSVTLLPLGVIAVRASAGVDNPASIILPSIAATACSTATAIVAAKWLACRSRFEDAPVEVAAEPGGDRPEVAAAESGAAPSGAGEIPDRGNPDRENPDRENFDNNGSSADDRVPPGLAGKVLFGGLILAFLGAIVYRASDRGLPYFFTTAFFASLSNWLLPVLICGFLLYGYFRGVKVYEALTEGAKEGFEIAVRIIPFMVAIFVAIGMFRASGALDLLSAAIAPVLAWVGMPPEALPLALIRPLSGSGAFALMSEIVQSEPNSFLADLVSVMQGSTDTTFYVLAVYFGSVGIVRSRYALSAGLCADAAGVVASVAICNWLLVP